MLALSMGVLAALLAPPIEEAEAVDINPLKVVLIGNSIAAKDQEPSTAHNPWGDWCRREDSNFHGISPTWPSTMRVYQFRHSDVG